MLLWQAALADPVAGPVLRGMFDAVLVDEYQDVNTVQASIVRLLQPDGKQLTCVGDDAQAIYGFRGADPAHLRQLVADYPGLDIVRLDRNYRSRQGILDLANLVRPSAPGLDLTLTGDRGPGIWGIWIAAAGPLPRRGHPGAGDLRPRARRARGRRGAAGPGGTGPAAHHSDILEIELGARKIPYVKFGGLRFTDTAHIKDFLATARILANPADDLAWFRLLRLHEGIGPVHARRVLAAGPDGPADGWQQAIDAAPARSRRVPGDDPRPPRRRCPPSARWLPGSTRPSAPCGMADMKEALRRCAGKPQVKHPRLPPFPAVRLFGVSCLNPIGADGRM